MGRVKTEVANRGKFKLTDKSLGFYWGVFGEYNFVDNDYINYERGGRMKLMGIPDTHRYAFWLFKVPKIGTRKVLMRMYFDADGKYTGIYVQSSIIKKKEIKEWESEALLWLEQNEYIVRIKQ